MIQQKYLTKLNSIESFLGTKLLLWGIFGPKTLILALVGLMAKIFRLEGRCSQFR